MEMAEAAADSAVAPAEKDNSASGEQGALGSLSEIPVTLPKLAFVLDYGFRLKPKEIAPLQQKHADMCEALGPYQCQIVSLTRTGEEDEIYGELQLAVASEKARGFATLLSAAAESDGAETFKANITGEDMSKSIVDTEARIRGRVALRDRLMEVLKTRKGTVQQLVEAERGVAAVNEEIDQAQSWLKEQKGRVAFSRMTLSYESATPGGSFLKPIEGAFGAIGSILGVLVAGIILMLAVVGPLVLGVFGVKRVSRRLSRDTAVTEA
ncbi:hypothetical protein ASD76_07315 [Altererythrobacter sp. Root672]|nr:hypothetical protein ASD76_07315 [Altererythrobacter sp. Root672]